MTETRAHEYSSESTELELSDEYQHDRIKIVFKNLFILVLWTKVAIALEGLKHPFTNYLRKNCRLVPDPYLSFKYFF